MVLGGADALGPWFGTGFDRGLALVLVVTGLIGTMIIVLALRSAPYAGAPRRTSTPGSRPRPTSDLEKR